jgi:xylulose-5-phosphate/fructose-6-phosphate phosphoketolase
MLTDEQLDDINAYWRAANYLTVGQIYLKDNPLLREPLQPDHIKPRLLGHWGTSPGLSLIYAHMNRAIRERNINAIFLAGPGHGGPAVVANVYLEGTYSEIYPSITSDVAGMRALFECGDILKKHTAYVREHLEDMPEIRDWVWSAP